MTAQTAASLVEVHARLLALVGKRDLEVVTFLRLATVEIPALVLVFADVVNVDDIHKTISVEVLVSIFVESFLSATVDIVRQHQHLLNVKRFKRRRQLKPPPLLPTEHQHHSRRVAGGPRLPR